MTPSGNFSKQFLLLVAALFLFNSCTLLSNRDYVQRYPGYRGIKRIAIFVQRWPVYYQLSGQRDLGMNLISKDTVFLGTWQPSPVIPRAIDILDIDDTLLGNLLGEVMTEKGYQPFVAELPFSARPMTVEEIMAQYQALDPDVDGFLFVYYSPTLFFAKAQDTPPDHWQRSYGLLEVIQRLHGGSRWVIWAGSLAAQAPPHSISHAFIYISLTMFKALNWKTLWAAADSQVGGRLRPTLALCPPPPSDGNYWADAAIIQRLMGSNVRCRLRHMFPDAF